MRISNSKKQLAKIIHENGGWRDGARFAWFQGKLRGHPCHEVWFGEEGSDPEYVPTSGGFHSYWSMVVDKLPAVKFDNWHQAILSREEYFHLHPTPDADGWIEWKGGECPVAEGTPISIRYRDGEEFANAFALGSRNSRWEHLGMKGDVVAYRLRKTEQAKPESDQAEETKPTIEQLAADYRNLKDYADRKQEEADGAKADADARLVELVAAGKALGLVLSVAAPEPEPELVITD